MNSWLQSMKQWTQWLMGEAPLPDGRSKAMLAGTVASVAVIAVGVPAAIPATTSADAASHKKVNPDANSSQYTVPSTAPKPTVPHAPTTVIAASGTTSTTSSQVAFDPYGTPKGAKQAKIRAAKAKAADGTTTTTTPAAPATALLLPATTTPPPANRAPTAPSAPNAPLIPISPIVDLVTPVTPPPAPLALVAQPFVASALVSWKAPVGSTSGYDVFVGFAPGSEFPIALNGATPVTGTSYLVTGLTPGHTYYFTVRTRNGIASSSASNELSAVPYQSYSPVGHLTGPVVSMASTADGTGYWLATASGAISPHGSATDLGTTSTLALAAPIIQIVADPQGGGYWEVAADGGIFAYGSAPYIGAASSEALNSPIVEMVPTATGAGYWEVASDGGVFAYGDAVYAGSLGGTAQSHPIVAMAVDQATGGYWLVSSDGTATGFNAPAMGPLPTALPNGPIVSAASTPDGNGLWEVNANGAVYAYGDAAFLGPVAPLNPATPVVSVTADPAATGGYWLASTDGGVYAYGSAFYGAG
jgi:hypothetical protein